MNKKTICLVMILKNNSHNIIDCFNMLFKYIQFDYWSIVDIGSTDGTQDVVEEYFVYKQLPGELINSIEENDNKTIAFNIAFKKGDYVFFWEVYNKIFGHFNLSFPLVADNYKFFFQDEGCNKNVLFNKNIIDENVIDENVKGEYYINNYFFYEAQTFSSLLCYEKAIDNYKKVLTLDGNKQNKYTSCIEIYDNFEKLNMSVKGLEYLLQSYEYDNTKIDGIYRLIKYYCINGPVEKAYEYYRMISDSYENQEFSKNHNEYDFYLPYYMIIVCERLQNWQTFVKMLEIIFAKKYTPGEWWIQNLFWKIQFVIPYMPSDLNFLENLLVYIQIIRKNGVELNENNNIIVDKIITKFRSLLIAPPSSCINIENNFNKKIEIMLTVTTCKRFDLFVQTIHSMLNTWLDLEKIDFFYCVDDNSSDEDRMKMQTMFPFFHYHMKDISEKGHRESMNVIWDKIKEVKPKFWIHMEDDWLYFKKEHYVTKSLIALEKYEDQNIHQIVFNREYGLMMNDMDRVNVAYLEDKEEGIVVHLKGDGFVGKNCAYWPHYSLHPSMCRASKILEIGDYTSPNSFFERDYADKYNAAGYRTMFYDFIYSIHIGKQHWEKDGQNAYALNQVAQLTGIATNVNSENNIKQINKPLNGSMRNHLEIILKKIKTKTPFGLIRPSDGEYKILKNETFTNCDEWTFKTGDLIRDQLAASISTVNQNLYIGIPCNMCNKPWNCTDEIYNDFIEKFKVPLSQRTYANLVGNSNWKRFIKFLKNECARFYLVTSGTTPTVDIPIKERFLINDKLVNTWNENGSSETKRLIEFIKEKKNQLILFSAGPISKIWIPMCLEQNPNNMYMDVGASLDIFSKGIVDRFYMIPKHSCSNEKCCFKDSLINNKNLVYFCIFQNTDIEFLRIALISIKLFSSQNIDFLVLTNNNLFLDIETLSETLQFPLIINSSVPTMNIFDVEKYEKILYLGIDVIIQGDLEKLFELDIHENKLYGLPNKKINNILLFKPSETIKKIFLNINDTSEITLIDKYVVDDNKDILSPDVVVVIRNFVLLTSTEHKRHFQSILNNYKDIYARDDEFSEVINSKWLWGDNGCIQINPNGILKTIWCNGIWKKVNSYTMIVSWSGFDHFLRFDTDYIEFTSVCINNNEIIFGTREV